MEAEVCFHPSSGFVLGRDGRLYFGNQWFEKYEDAIKDFETKREQKIKVLEEKIQKLRDRKPVLRKERRLRARKVGREV